MDIHSGKSKKPEIFPDDFPDGLGPSQSRGKCPRSLKGLGRAAEGPCQAAPGGSRAPGGLSLGWAGPGTDQTAHCAGGHGQARSFLHWHGWGRHAE